MARNIAAVAVLLMNIEKMATVIIMPSSTNLGFLPKGLISTRARLRSSLNFVAAAARKKPPMKSMMVGSAQVAITSLKLSRFLNFSPSASTIIGVRALFEMVKSIRTMMRIDVEKIGTGSRIHAKAAKTNIATTRCSTGLIVTPSWSNGM